ncbi:MAG TPA: metallopeptidase TldD-related protein [Solirubrobacteraceae bacterium]|jgi:predicted Zn-dependent protease|nr:metallopeptidase TldD-related protein [Solirubrobacteraceae bacterium]
MTEVERDLAERTLGFCDGDAQVNVTRERSLASRFARSVPTQATAVDDTTVEVLCLLDGHVGTASTNRLDADALREVAGRARRIAAAAARAGRGDHPGLPQPDSGLSQPADPRPAGDPAGGSDPVEADDARVGHDAATAELDPAVAGDALGAAFATAQRHATEAFGIWSAGEVSTAIVSSAGIRSAESVTDAHMKVICRDATGRSGYAATTSVGSGALDGAEIAQRAAAKLNPAHPVELPPGEYEVVLDHEAVGTLLDFLGWLAFNGLAHAEHRGALSDRLGQAVAAPAINLSDAPGLRRGLPRSYDADGIRKVRLQLIDDGVARSVVHDTRSAALAGGGARSTGHALAPGGDPDGPAPTNLLLAGGGATSLDELVRPVERGLYVTRLWYVNPVDPRHTLLTGVTRDGTFLIEDGQITRPLLDVRFTDSVLRILAETVELTRDRRLVTEADHYGRRFAHGVVCPAVRATGFRVTGSTT